MYSPPLDCRTVNLQCLVFLTVDNSYRSRQLVALAPCYIWAEAVCAGDGLSLYSFSAWNSHAIITIQYRLSVSEIFYVQTYHHLLTVLSSIITR